MNTKKRSLKTLMHESLIFGFLFYISDFLCEKFKSSRIVQYFTSYDFYRRQYETSLLSGIVGKISPGIKRRHKVKFAVSGAIENSFIVQKYKALINSLLCRKISYTGGGILTFGITTAVVYLVNRYLHLGRSELSDFVMGIVMLIASLPLIMSRQSWSSVIPKSRIVGGFLCNLADFREDEIRRAHTTGHGFKRSLLIGFLLGLATSFVSGAYIVLGLVGLIAVAVIIYKPEVGCLAIVGLLPFLPTMMLCALVALTAVSYILKLIRGKRTFRFEASDLFVVLFMAILLLGGLSSLSVSSSIKSAAVFICLMTSYFLITNLVTTTKMIRSLSIVTVASLLICSLYGIYQNYFGISEAAWLDSDMFSEIETRVYSTFGNPNVFGEYLIMVIPIALALLFTKQSAKKRFAALCIAGISGIALIFTWSRGAWLGFGISMILFFLLLSRRTMIVYMGGIMCLPFALPYLPSSIVTRFTSIGNLADTSTNYRVSIWKAAVRMIYDHPLSGIGIGEGAFAIMYQNYSLSGIEAAPHSHMLYLQIWIETGLVGLVVFLMTVLLIFKKVFAYYRNGTNTEMKIVSLAAVCGITAILIQGFTDYVWYNYRVFALFWIMCAFAVSAVRCAQKEEATVQY